MDQQSQMEGAQREREREITIGPFAAAEKTRFRSFVLVFMNKLYLNYPKTHYMYITTAFNTLDLQNYVLDPSSNPA